MNRPLKGRGGRLAGVLAPLAALALVAVFAPVASAGEKPVAWTWTASDVLADGATLTAFVGSSEGQETSYQFEYGTDTSYGSSAPAEPKSAGTGTFAEVGEPVTGLEPGVTYHYRVVASNGAGTSYGQDETFTTEPLEVVNPATGPCSPVSVEEGTVYGGCLAEDLNGIGGNVSINGWHECALDLGEMRIGGNGALYTSNMKMYNAACGTSPCPDRPWAGKVGLAGAGELVVELEVCFEHSIGGQESEVVSMSLEFDGGELVLDQHGFSEEGDLLHNGYWTTENYDFEIWEL